MISVIVPTVGDAYLRGMASAFFRLLALAALLLMPAGMAGAPALAQPAPAAAGHCDEHRQPADAPAKQQAHCAACAALPTLDAPEPGAALRPQPPLRIAEIQPIPGMEPEIATPPPKLS